MMNRALTFVLVKGGHNAGIISEPGNPRGRYRLHKRKNDNSFLSPEDWYQVAEEVDGSWWPAWSAWLVENSDPKRVAPPELDSKLPKAPGTYVFQKE